VRLQSVVQYDWRNVEALQVMSAVPLMTAARVAAGVTSLMGQVRL
jgi:hypothetical protein